MPKEKFNPQYKENPISPERQKIIDEVTTLGLDTENPIHFEDFGSESKQEEIKLNSKTLEGLDEETINDIKNIKTVFNKFIEKPIFTDSFHENHSNKEDPEANTRRKWEEDNLNKISEAGQNYYNSNSFNFNNIYYTMSSFDVLEHNIQNSEIKNKISELIEKFPQELSKKVDNILIYNTLTDNRKIEVIKQFKEILKQTIYILTK